MMISLKRARKDTKQKKLFGSSQCRVKHSLSKSSSSSSSSEKNPTLQNFDQGDVSSKVSAINSDGKTQAHDHSPVSYTLSHLLDVNLRNCSEQSTPLSSRLEDSLDITIYWADERGFKFSLVGGKLATASSLLLLLADHLDIVAEVFEQVCALWMVSDLLEVQLKPHHNPYQIRKNWMQILHRFTSAESSETAIDEPLLILKRNVQLSVEREHELEKEYTNETLTEILYISAKQEILNGRYICDIDNSIKLAALQMAIDLEPNENLDMDTFGEVAEAFFPLKYRHCVKTFHLFGFPVIGCKGLETRILEEYRNIRRDFESKHGCRKAYLDTIRNTPFYGAAFFRGYVERPSERKKMIFSVTLSDIPILIGISCGYVTLIDEGKQEVLLVQRLQDCDCRYLDDHFEVAISAGVLTKYPCFLLTFPDASFLPNHNLNSETEMLKFTEKLKVLQVFSKQAVMIEALMNSLSTLLEGSDDDVIPNLNNNFRKMEVVQSESSGLKETLSDSSSDGKGTHITKILVNGYNVQQNRTLAVIDSQYRSSPNPSHMDDQKGNISASRSLTNVCSSSCPVINGVGKLCLATVDADGHCVEAQGSLRVLLEVM